MEKNNKIKKNGRKYFIKENFFIKKYPLTTKSSLIKEEYEKGLKINNIINYPKPITFDKNSITYELINIQSNIQKILENKIGSKQLKFFRKIGFMLGKLHQKKIIHGDFNTWNVVMTKDEEIFFIDASFSKYTNENKVNLAFEPEKDLSLFLFFVKNIRSIKKLYKLFKKREIEQITRSFLNAYSKNMPIPKNFKQTLTKEEQKYKKLYLKQIADKKNFLRFLLWKMIFLIKR